MRQVKRSMTRTALLTGLALAFLSAPRTTPASHCAKPSEQNRPRIGLVLGGGGARGGAHVGVLKFLEERRVPIDVIAGTSMGAIIGGLYASGMSAEEIESVMIETPWKELFSDSTPRRDRTLRRKTDDQLSMFGPKLGVGKGSTVLPGGAVAGQKISLLFEQLVSQRTRESNFDKLPIPYRAVSADLTTGDMVLLDSGQLSLAMRASMSVPGAFDPIRMGDALLVDGGIVNNVPIDIARQMGAEVVIAVDVSYPELGADQIDNLLSVVNQLTTLMVSSNTQRQIASLGQEDILLEPALGDEFSSADFPRIAETIEIGYTAAVQSAERIQSLSVDQAAYTDWRAGIENCKSPPATLQFVRLENNSRFSDEVIRSKIHVQPGDLLDQDWLQRDIAQVYGLGFIRNAQYRLVEENGATGVVIEVDQDPRGTDFVETGIGIAGDGFGTTLDFRVGYLKTDLNERGAEFRSAIQFGSDFGLSAEVYLPLDDRLRWILRPEVFASRRDFLAYNENGHPLGELEVNEFGGRLSFGREFGRHAGLFAALTRYRGDIDVSVGFAPEDSYDFEGGDLSLLALYDRLDDFFMPSSGDYFSLEYIDSLESLGADHEFEQVRAGLFSARSWGRHTAWLASTLNTTLNDNAPVYGLYTGGGFLYMSGYQPDELVGQHFGFSLLGYRYQMGQSGLLPAYVGTTVEYGGAADKRSDVYGEGILNGSVYLGYNSPIGPLYLGYGWNEEQSGVYFLRLGTILGRRSLGRR